MYDGGSPHIYGDCHQHGPGSEQNMKPDMEKYRAMLAEYDISEAERDEFIATMWSLCLQFVDMGLGVDNTQLALKETWEKAENSASVLVDDSDDLEYTNHLENNKKSEGFEP